LNTPEYLYEVFLENRESENCVEVLKEEIYKVIYDSSLNEKHDCNDVIINSIIVNCVNNMQNPKLGDANFSLSTTYCNDHDWGDVSYDLEKLFNHHDEYDIDNNVCNNMESGFGRVLTLGNNPTTLENYQSCEFFDESGFGEVMTLVNDNPTILEECQLYMQVVQVENMLCDRYIVEFEYDPTCNYYERGKYGYRNFHVKLPLVMIGLSMFPSSLHMLDFACLDDVFAYKMPMHRKYVRLKCVCHMFYDALFVLQFLSFM
jgi:hypothetical protein